MEQSSWKAFRDSLGVAIRARLPIIYVNSYEESRVLNEVRAVASDPAVVTTARPVAVWGRSEGVRLPDGELVPETDEPLAALKWIRKQTTPGVFVMLDLHMYLGGADGQRNVDPQVLRMIRDLVQSFQSAPQAPALVIIAPAQTIPMELQKDVTLVDFALPTEEEIHALLESIVASNTQVRVDLDQVGRERLAKAAVGLTASEATNAFARAMVDSGVLNEDDIATVREEKRQAVRKSGMLEYVDVDISLDDVAGLQNLKRWLEQRNNAWLNEAAAYGIPAPKGVLMTGVPGCGKSLTAKATAAAWDLPLLRLDIGKVFGEWYGVSERNMRSALAMADAVSPCVLWIDEIEKGFAQNHGDSGGKSGGTAGRVLSTFLTWMQERATSVFVTATANSVSSLPPEFLRKGRFDEVFFVDLPTPAERKAIWKLQLDKKLRGKAAGGVEVSDELLNRLVIAADGFSGAEIEQVTIAALYSAYAGRRPVTEDDVVGAVRATVPLSVTQAEAVAATRAWASNRAVPATAPEDRANAQSPGGVAWRL